MIKSFFANAYSYFFLPRFAFSNESISHLVFQISRFGVHETLPIKALNFPGFQDYGRKLTCFMARP